MKKILITLLVLVVSLTSFAATKDYHIGIVSTTVSQSEDAVRAAELLTKTYGNSAKGGIITHVILPDNFMQEQETTISQIANLANDPKMKAIVVIEAVPGTVEAFRKVKEKRPDILLIANIPHEDPGMIASVADLAVNKDSVSRGYLIVKSAKTLGAKTFMHLSFPRHMSIELMSRRKNIMKAAAKDLGIEFVEMTVPDPMSEVGVAGAQQYILEQMPTWVAKYGKDTAFFATNDAQTEPLLKQVAKYGAIFVEPDTPSPTMGYPGAFGIKFTDSEKGNWPKILSKVETAVIAAGGKGRMGTWSYSSSFSVPLGLTYRVMDILDKGGDAKAMKKALLEEKPLMAAFAKATPGAEWSGALLADTKGIEMENYLLVYQDTYVFGKGYLGATKEKVPAKYFKIK